PRGPRDDRLVRAAASPGGAHRRGPATRPPGGGGMSTTAVTAHPERRRRSIPLTAIGLLWALVAAGPFVFLLLASFKARLELLVSEVWALPQDPSLANYRAVLENDFLVFLRNSVVGVTLSVVLIIVVSAPAAYVFG